MRLAIHEILENASKQKTKKEKIEYLHLNHNPVLLSVIKHAFDPGIEFDLPPGAPPYSPSEYMEDHGMLYTEARKFYLFVKGGNPNLTALKRESLFITLLESVHPGDAKLLISMKDKKLPYKSITKQLIKEAFPGLIDEQEK